MVKAFRRGVARYAEGTGDVAYDQVLDALRSVNQGISSGTSGMLEEDDDMPTPRLRRDVPPQLRRGVAGYQSGTSDVPYPASRFPASGLLPDLSNAVQVNGFSVAPGDPAASIAAREQMYLERGVQPQITPEYMKTQPGQAYAADLQARGFNPIIRNQPGQRGGDPAFAPPPSEVAPAAPAAPAVPAPGPLTETAPASSSSFMDWLIPSAHAGGTPVTRRTSTAPATPTAPSGIGQLFSGLFTGDLTDLTGAQQNTEASKATRDLAGLAEMYHRSRRASDIATPPSVIDKAINLFTGNPASDAEIARHDQTARTLSQPLVQQYLRSDPVGLAEAERDRHGFAQRVQTDPEFTKYMQTAVGVNAAAAANPKVTRDNHQTVVSKVLSTPGATVDQANAALVPHYYTKEEFRNAMLGAPMQVVQQLFGNRLAHIPSVQEKAATELFDRKHGAFTKASDRVMQMELDQKKAEDAGEPIPAHSQSGRFGFGQSEYAKMKAERDKLEAELIEMLKSASGISTKAISVPSQDIK